MSESDVPTFVVEPTSGWRAIDVREIWAYRELLVIFAWRDVRVRYRQTFLGVVWVMGQPLITMLLFTFVFNRVARLQSGSAIPYPLFVLSGVVLWTFFSSTITLAGNSLIGASFLISKVYFPRLIIPLSNVVVGLVDFAVAMLLLGGMMAWYRVAPAASLLLLPVPIVICSVLAVGFGLWIAALNVEYRDVRVIIPFILQLAMYATPVVYPMSALPARYQPFAAMNPMSGVVEAFRGAIFGTTFSTLALAWSGAFAVVVLIGGMFYFRRMERRFADVL